MEQEPLQSEMLRVRISSELKKRIDVAYETCGVSEPTLVRDALHALLSFIEQSRGGYNRKAFLEHTHQLHLLAASAPQDGYEVKKMN